MRAAIALFLLAPALAAPSARAQDYFAPAQPEMQTVARSRSKRTKIVLASLAGGALLGGGVGLLFHLKSRDLSDEISAHSGDPTGLTYSAEIDGKRQDALRDRKVAIGAYGLGSALLVAAAVGFILTDPGDELVPLLGTEPVVVPTQGGALIGAQGTF